jgi:hypothetical protein
LPAKTPTVAAVAIDNYLLSVATLLASLIFQVSGNKTLRLQSLDVEDREACVRRVRDGLSGADDEQYVYRGEVFMATAFKADATG